MQDDEKDRAILKANTSTVTDLKETLSKTGKDVGYLENIIFYMPIPVAERSKAWVCSRSPAGTAGSNPAEGMDIYLL
jgi:hypothetical protein